MSLEDFVDGWGDIVIFPVLLIGVALLGVWLYERRVARRGRRGSPGLGDAFANIIDVLDPAQARAGRDLKDQQNVGPVRKTPERDPDDPIQMTLGPDGNPKSVRIRRDR